MARYQENNRRKRMWFGTQHHSEWITCPLRGAEMSPESWGLEGTYLSGGGFVRQSQDSHRQYIFEWSGASSREAAERVQAYRDGVYNKSRSDLIYFIDPLMYSRNILPKRWAQPGILTVPGGAEYTSVGVVAPVDTPVSVLGNQKVPMIGARVSSPFTTLNSFRGAIIPGAGSVWVPIPEGETLTIIAWTGNPATSESGLYVKAQTTGGSWRDPQEVNLLGVTITGAKGVLLAAVGMFDFYGARAVIGRGEGWTEPAVYDWTGSPNNSASTRTTPEGVVTNLFTNPDMVLSSTNTVVRRNLLPHPAPPQDRNTTNPPGWTITRGDSAIAALTDLLSTGGKFPPEGLSGIKGVRSGNFGSGIFPSNPPPIEFISGADAESRASVTSGTTYYASMYMWKRGWEGEKAEMPVRAVIRWYNSSGNAISDSTGSDVDLSDGGWGLLEVSGSAPSGAVSAAVIGQLEGFSGFLPNNHYTHATGAILQTSPGPYFDGDFSLQDGTTAWSGTPGESPSSETVDLGSEVVVWENLIPDPDPTTAPGRYTTTGITASSHEDGRLVTFEDAMESGQTTFYRSVSSNGHTPVEEGEVYSARGGVRNISDWPVTLRFGMIRTTGASLVLSSARSDDVTVQPGEYVEIEVPGIELNDTWNTVRVGWVAPSEGEIPAGTEIVLSDGFTVMKGPRAPLLVSTQFSPDPDLEPRERSGGGAELVGRSPARVGNNTSTRRAVISEEVRSPLGTNSMKQIVPEVDTGTTPYGNTFVGSTGGLQGRTITAVAWCYIPDGYDDSDDVALGNANRIARTLYAYSGGTGSLDNGYAQAPATPGWHLVRAHISLPEDVSDNAIRVTPSYKVNQPIYWSNVTIVDDPSYSGPPFSGNTPDEGPLWLTGTGNSGCKIVGNPTWVANSGVNGGQIGYAATLKEVGDW